MYAGIGTTEKRLKHRQSERDGGDNEYRGDRPQPGQMKAAQHSDTREIFHAQETVPLTMDVAQVLRRLGMLKDEVGSEESSSEVTTHDHRLKGFTNLHVDVGTPLPSWTHPHGFDASVSSNPSMSTLSSVTGFSPPASLAHGFVGASPQLPLAHHSLDAIDNAQSSPSISPIPHSRHSPRHSTATIPPMAQGMRASPPHPLQGSLSSQSSKLHASGINSNVSNPLVTDETMASSTPTHGPLHPSPPPLLPSIHLNRPTVTINTLSLDLSDAPAATRTEKQGSNHVIYQTNTETNNERDVTKASSSMETASVSVMETRAPVVKVSDDEVQLIHSARYRDVYFKALSNELHRHGLPSARQRSDHEDLDLRTTVTASVSSSTLSPVKPKHTTAPLSTITAHSMIQSGILSPSSHSPPSAQPHDTMRSTESFGAVFVAVPQTLPPPSPSSPHTQTHPLPSPLHPFASPKTQHASHLPGQSSAIPQTLHPAPAISTQPPVSLSSPPMESLMEREDDEVREVQCLPTLPGHEDDHVPVLPTTSHATEHFRRHEVPSSDQSIDRASLLDGDVKETEICSSDNTVTGDPGECVTNIDDEEAWAAPVGQEGNDHSNGGGTNNDGDKARLPVTMPAHEATEIKEAKGGQDESHACASGADHATGCNQEVLPHDQQTDQGKETQSAEVKVNGTIGLTPSETNKASAVSSVSSTGEHKGDTAPTLKETDRKGKTELSGQPSPLPPVFEMFCVVGTGPQTYPPKQDVNDKEKSDHGVDQSEQENEDVLGSSVHAFTPVRDVTELVNNGTCIPTHLTLTQLQVRTSTLTQIYMHIHTDNPLFTHSSPLHDIY